MNWEDKFRYFSKNVTTVENQRDVLAARNIKKFAFLDNPTTFFKEVYSGAGKKAE